MRNVVLQFHRWIGLTLGIVVVFIASTGALIAYRQKLEPIVNRDLLTVPACTARVPLDTLTASARAAHPTGVLDYVRITNVSADPTRTRAAQVRVQGPGFQDDVFLDPCTGKVLGQRARYGGFLGTVEGLHKLRFLPPGWGNLVAGTAAAVFAILFVGGGLYMWWPRGLQTFANSARLNPRLTGGARSLNRHKVVGAYAALIALSSAVTGLPQAFDPVHDFLHWVTGSPPRHVEVASKPVPGAAFLPMEEYWTRAQALVVEPREALIHIPVKPTDPVEMYLIDRDAPHANARTLLALDAYSGEVLHHMAYAQSNIAHRIYFWSLSWHDGALGGLFGPFVIMLGALSIPFLGYTGASSFLRRQFQTAPANNALVAVRVVAKAREAADISTFELARPDGRPLPNFSAGAHIDVHVPGGHVRQYSLCNDPSETHRYLIGVLNVPDTRGGSRGMHEKVNEGDLIEISEPRNHFPLAHGAKRSVLLAGGIGITPLLCMAERLANAGADFELHYCTRSRERTAFVARIEKSAFAKRVHFHFDDGPAEQKLDIAAVLAKPAADTHLYVCGPRGFMDFALQAASAQGWPSSSVHKEYFSGGATAQADDTAFDVKLASTGKTYRVAADQSVVAALREQGIDIPTSCESGVCGTCLTRIIEGEALHRDVYQSDAEHAKGDQFTPCCSRAKSSTLVLDL